MKKSMNKKQGIDPFYGKINWASVSQQPLITLENLKQLHWRYATKRGDGSGEAASSPDGILSIVCLPLFSRVAH